jgi:sugar phosphate isomerase/epimerase
MEIIFAKSKWEVWNEPTDEFLQRVKADGFDSTEFYLNEGPDSPEDLVNLHTEYGLKLIAQIVTEGGNFKEHFDSLSWLADKVLKCNPILVNCQPGRDYFSFDENLKILGKLVELSEETGILFTAETHRGRSTYSLIETVKYLQELPQLCLTADVSHWMVVHESDLSAQKDNLDLAVSASRHIHARVGYEEGPQVTDPRAPEWKAHLDNHLSIWQGIVDNCKSTGMKFLAVTPEFGPPKYMHTLPFSNEPVADAWEINKPMKHILSERLKL